MITTKLVLYLTPHIELGDFLLLMTRCGERSLSTELLAQCDPYCQELAALDDCPNVEAHLDARICALISTFGEDYFCVVANRPSQVPLELREKEVFAVRKDWREHLLEIGDESPKRQAEAYHARRLLVEHWDRYGGYLLPYVSFSAVLKFTLWVSLCPEALELTPPIELNPVTARGSAVGS